MYFFVIFASHTVTYTAQKLTVKLPGVKKKINASFSKYLQNYVKFASEDEAVCRPWVAVMGKLHLQ